LGLHLHGLLPKLLFHFVLDDDDCDGYSCRRFNRRAFHLEMRVFFREAVPQGDAMPGAVMAIQAFGDLLGFNPPCPVLCTDGCFDEKALFRVAPRFGPEGLKAIFERKVFSFQGEDHPGSYPLAPFLAAFGVSSLCRSEDSAWRRRGKSFLPGWRSNV
jgi:hypothetical protein